MPKEVKTEEIAAKVVELHGLYKRMNQQLLSEHAINESAVNIISIIGEDEKTLKEITEASGLDKSTVSRQVNALVKKNMVTKTTGEDKRYAYFTLSKEASEVVNQYTTSFETLLSHTLSGWTEEEKQMLLVLLGRLNRSLTNNLD
jgi:DNA-binding MarR family transcriptional regulator